MKTQIHPILLDRITRLLDDHEIAHGDLVEGQPHLNLNASDQSRVFVKVSRAGPVLSRTNNEVTSARWAKGHGVLCAEPLLDETTLLDENDQSRDVTVWEWVQFCCSPSLYDRALDTLGMIEQISAVPAPFGAQQFDLEAYILRVHSRLDQESTPVADAILEVADATAGVVKRLSATRTPVWSHADLHLLNIGWDVAGRPVVFDWESAAIAPVEFDLAQLLRSIEVNAPDYFPEERSRVAQVVIRDADTRFDVDWDLVEAMARFRSASAASHLYVTADRPQLLAANLRHLDAATSWRS